MDKTENKEKLRKEEQEEQKKLDKEQKAREEERLKKRKLKEKKAKARQRKELKRIRYLIHLPFKILTNISIIAALLSFVITYFLLNKDPISTIMTSFLVFSAIYLGIGLLTIGAFWLVSIEKEKELLEAEREEELRKLEDERRKQEEEMKELEQIEKEISSNRFKGERAKPYLENEQSAGFNSKIPEMPQTNDLGPNLINSPNNTFNPLDSFATEPQDEDYLKEMLK